MQTIRQVPAGQLSAIWECQPEPGYWRLNYRSGTDGLGVAKRFQWHAQSASARLSFKGEGDAAVAHWLDQIKGDAPRAHVRRLVGGGSLESIELLDICGLSAAAWDEIWKTHRPPESSISA